MPPNYKNLSQTITLIDKRVPFWVIVIEFWDKWVFYWRVFSFNRVLDPRRIWFTFPWWFLQLFVRQVTVPFVISLTACWFLNEEKVTLFAMRLLSFVDGFAFGWFSLFEGIRFGRNMFFIFLFVTGLLRLVEYGLLVALVIDGRMVVTHLKIIIKKECSGSTLIV